jgi:plastocyanin
LTGGLVVAALALAVGSPVQGSVQREVLIPGKFFAPRREVVLIGDAVTWRNQDSSSHTVTAEDRSFDSGSLPPGATFSREFGEEGTHVYFCSIHRYMRAEVDVYGLALSAPGYAVPFGEQVSLKGLAPPTVGQVTIRRREPDETWVAVGTAAVASDGAFRFPLVAEKSVEYVATTGSLSSGHVTLLVAPRLRLRAEKKGTRIRLLVSTHPAQPRALVRLEHYVFERFAFEPFSLRRLDAKGTAFFSLSLRGKVHVRALLPAGVQGYGRAVSATLLVRPRR